MLNRIVDVRDGMVMVVTDLHGDWALYERYRDVFLHLYERGLVQTLVVTGDFIHSNGPAEQDGSLNIVLDLMALRDSYGDAVIALLGNHEMSHIYDVTLQRGHHTYTPRFEHAMGGYRETIIAFFMDLPFFVRTPAGVTVCHAGAFPEIYQAGVFSKLAYFSHRDLLQQAQAKLKTLSRKRLRNLVSRQMGVAYAGFTREYFAVTDEDDPRYDAYLLGQQVSTLPEFDLLWAVLFSRNERAHDMPTYSNEVRLLLQALSQKAEPQQALVCGHIGCRGGARVIAGGQQLRLVSGMHARPYEAAKYLIFDAAQTMSTAKDLLPGLGSVFDG